MKNVLIITMLLFIASHISFAQSPTLQIVSFCPEDLTCRGGTQHTVTAIGGTPPYTFIWSNGQTDENVDTSIVISDEISGERELTVMVVDQNDQSDEAAVDLECPVIPSYELIEERSCVTINCQGFLDVTIKPTGVPPYNFFWNGSFTENSLESTQRIPINSEAVELVVVDSELCVSTLFVSTESCFDTLSILYVDFVIQPARCTLSDGRIEANPMEGVPPYTYLWNTGQMTKVIENLEIGQYIVTVTDANGCESSNTAFITNGESFFPIGDLNIDQGGCNNNSALVNYVTEENYTYLWSNGSTDSSLILEQGVYELTLFNELGCSFTLPPVVIGAGSGLSTQVNVECGSECNPIPRIAVNANGAYPYVYNWSNGLSGPQYPRIDAVIGEVYSVTVTDANGCEVIESNLTATNCNTVEIDPRLRVYFECQDSNFVLTESLLHAEVLSNGIPPYIFEWNTGQKDTAFYRSSLDFSRELDSLFLIEVKVTDALGNIVIWNAQPQEYGCGPDSNFIKISAPDIIVSPGESFAYPIYIENGDELARGIYTIDWDDCIVRVDSIVSFPFSENPIVFSGSEVFSNTYEIFWGDIFPVQDSMLSHFIYFTALEDAEGISPFLFSVNEVPILNDGSSSFFRPKHGSITVAQQLQLVRAGDSNNNGSIDHYDILNNGLAFGGVGPERRIGISNGSDEYGIPWQQVTPTSITDYKHIDANGDGVIDQADSDLIQSNWGLYTEDPSSVLLSNINSSAPLLHILNDTLFRGQINELRIGLGSETTPVNGAYGIAFDLYLDRLFPQSLDLAQSWLAIETDLQIMRFDPLENKVQIAIVGKDRQDKTGFGEILRIKAWIPDDVNFFIDFFLDKVSLINAEEQQLDINKKSQTIRVSEVISSNNTIDLDQFVNIFPNPATSHLIIKIKNLQGQEITMTDLNGKEIIRIPYQNKLNIRRFQAGIYFLKLRTDQGVITKKWVKF